MIVSRVFSVSGDVFSLSALLAMGQPNFANTLKTEHGKLYSIAVRMRARLSTDPWDKLYSLMGIAIDIDSSFLSRL